MALDKSKNIEVRPSLYTVLINFAYALEGADNICKDGATARHLAGIAINNLAADLEAAFKNIDITPLPVSDESSFLDTEALDLNEESPRQIPVMAKPMLALVPILKEEASKLLNGSNRKASLDDVHFRLRAHQNKFTVSAEVVESLVDSLTPLRETRFESRFTTEPNVIHFAQAVAAKITENRANAASKMATGPDQALIAQKISEALKKSA